MNNFTITNSNRIYSQSLARKQKFIFSFSTFIAGILALGIALWTNLPRPWWALLTVYVTAQPMAGAFRPKVLYRLGGIAIGAIVAIVLVPALQPMPGLLVLCLAVWTGLCIYLAVLDRTPRAFLFQMSAFCSAVMSFPYIDDPGRIFDTTIARVEEMAVAILCVTVVHALLQPWSAAPVIQARAQACLQDARNWVADALSGHRTRLEHKRHRTLAADITELGLIAVHLPFDQRWAPATRKRVTSLQRQLANILPLASAIENRLDELRRTGRKPREVETLLSDVTDWLTGEHSRPETARRLTRRAEDIARNTEAKADWNSLLTASACVRIAECLTALNAGRRLADQIDKPGRPLASPAPAENFKLAHDHGVAALAGIATTVAITLYCAAWILLAWPNGSATAAFAALITCSFATQDDPAPTIGRYLAATLKTFPLAALYLFAILPRVDGYGMLALTLAPALLWIGHIQADPKRSAQALPMASCFIVALGFMSRFQPDFALFVNTGLAQLGGIVVTLAVTRMFRSANAAWTARRILRANWGELTQLANIRRPFLAEQWTGKALDRLGQLAERMALSPSNDTLKATDDLADIRIGRNIISIRKALPHVPHAPRRKLGAVLTTLSRFYGEHWTTGQPSPPPAKLLDQIDAALRALLALELEASSRAALRALVGMRCNLFTNSAPFASAPK